jgi:hypothetical protein
VSTYSENCNLKVTAERLSYTPPTGFKLLNAKNLPEPTVLQPSEGFNILPYTGDGTTPRAITGVGFAPDLVWVKNLTGAWGHNLQDTVRGNNLTLFPDANTAEQASHTRGYISSMDSDGFTVTTGGTDAHYVNYNTEDYVAWCWKKAAKYGFDIQSYTGNGVAGKAITHDLGAVPEMIWVKNRDQADSWVIYHHAAANKTDPYTDYGRLDVVSGAEWTDFDMWNDTAPTSTQFTVSTYAGVNTNTENYISYLWRSVPGFSKIWQFTGNGNADGPFVNCGFRPRWILFRASAQETSWYLYDAERDVDNVAQNYLVADTTAAETTNANFVLDILSNGFKVRGTAAGFNASNINHIGMAIAEQPGKFANAR